MPSPNPMPAAKPPPPPRRRSRSPPRAPKPALAPCSTRRQRRPAVARYLGDLEMFQSTPPARAATRQSTGQQTTPSCFNPRRPRRAATRPPSRFARVPEVSIHAARAGGDCPCGEEMREPECFNPRRPRGRRRRTTKTAAIPSLFQSTPPARAATGVLYDPSTPESVSIHAARAGGDDSRPWRGCRRSCFNPRRPRGRRRIVPSTSSSPQVVSIHAARAGGDHPPRSLCAVTCCFNPRRPRGRRRRSQWLITPKRVSIHAARAGGDMGSNSTAARRPCFNPRRPRGRRPDEPEFLPALVAFQSTPPARAATSSARLPTRRSDVSIHAARAGGDRHVRFGFAASVVSIHAARAGGDPG